MGDRLSCYDRRSGYVRSDGVMDYTISLTQSLSNLEDSDKSTGQVGGDIRGGVTQLALRMEGSRSQSPDLYALIGKL